MTPPQCAAPNCYEPANGFACADHWRRLPWYTQKGIRKAVERLADPDDPKPLDARISDLEDAHLAALEAWTLGEEANL